MAVNLLLYTVHLNKVIMDPLPRSDALSDTRNLVNCLLDFLVGRHPSTQGRWGISLGGEGGGDSQESFI